ncbi:AraC-type DNA-binding protein [Micromonospora phaseoli]|uniref:AraC-type DNA-binding protein n=1 Tax=Micromonospora phaseoli TaxID=1144548 RepID=A0A1H7AM98_9ACTN|nr:AraC family transcriptional regulator [Micromonospora phaseoli]PZV96462.1 AraC-like DNA-binding protein [Micromonospora phaseoli]GIJ76150.1 AraC family transcriptional regulator [Micromonospora phaseoli]SEJ63212.1 AraC-type DNA-binding protein [Micromonospora phaseoli]
MCGRGRVRVWSPSVGGIAEVLHAHFTDHAYPMHTHDSWTLLTVDDGIVRYDLDRHEHGAFRQVVTLLPPNVAHNGSPVTPQGFRKRVLYLDRTRLGARLVGRAVDRPTFDDAALRRRIDLLHARLTEPGDEFAAEVHLAFVVERLRAHLSRRTADAATVRDPQIARRLRELLDERFVEGVTLAEAANLLHAHPTYLVRAYSAAFGIGPHQYVISRRVDLARRLLREGVPARDVAATAGFHDQSHLNRHFKRILGFNPGQYARDGRLRGASGPP